MSNGSLECEGMVVKQIAGSKCTTIDELFAEFAEVLQFPDYFGNNWAAFDECLNDLDWLPGEAYLLIIEDADQVITISDNSFKIFIEILKRSVNEWTEGRNYDDFLTPPIPFHVVFQCPVKKINDVKERLKMAGLKNVNIISIKED
ncbi:barstar family protein [Defluviitalea phaphyphila]|uniref:barstar family protein n=1 Tax=Defluviitalea phaphyphila TaxID=1473580 RepID=UPI001365DA7D|nr:barstar family protein [Defluviitalea phaphyphila]